MLTGASPPSQAVPASPAVAEALRRRERDSAKRVTIARTLLFLVLPLWLLVNYGPEIALTDMPVFAAFILSGLVIYWLQHGRNDRGWLDYLGIVIDSLLVTWTLLAPGRTYPEEWPWAMVLRQPSFIYGLLILVLTTLSFRASLVLWAGFCISSAWGVAALMIIMSEGTVSSLESVPLGPDAGNLERYLHPSYVHVDDVVVRIFVTMLLSLILALSAAQARKLIFAQAEAARARANLARYVAPSMVDQLATNDNPMGSPRELQTVVLFADIRGFTRFAQGRSAQEVMGVLREFHGRMAQAVFDHGGTLDKFIGDGLMATFGTPEPRADDAVRALACARSMLRRLAEWNEERRAAGEPAIAIGLGLHAGIVTAGDIGGGHRFEYAVIGDTVNVASRLERLTRQIDVPLLASDALVARLDGPTPPRGSFGEGHGLERVGSQSLPGRDGELGLWALNKDEDSRQS